MRLRERGPEVACSTVRKTDRGLRRLSWTQKKSSRKGKIPRKKRRPLVPAAAEPGEKSARQRPVQSPAYQIGRF